MHEKQLIENKTAVLHESPNCVTIGHVCLSCALFATKTCPYKNHERTQVSQFQGDIRGKCTYYMSVAEANGANDMIKEANVIKEADLNVAIYKKLYALSDSQRNKLFDYWGYLFPEKYAHDMVTDTNESKQKGLAVKKIDKEDPKKTKKDPKKKDINH